MNNIIEKANITETLKPNKKGDKNNDKEREKCIQETCNDGVNDMIRILKTEQGKLHEVVRIKTQECDKLMQYVSGLERTIINMKEGRFQKIHEFVYNQSDHIRVAQISQNVLQLQKTTDTLTQLMTSILGKLDNYHDQGLLSMSQNGNIQGVPKIANTHATSVQDAGKIQGDQEKHKTTGKTTDDNIQL